MRKISYIIFACLMYIPFANAKIASNLGIPKENIFIMHSGDVLELNEEEGKMYFEQFNAKKGELSDDELDAVAGVFEDLLDDVQLV